MSRVISEKRSRPTTCSSSATFLRRETQKSCDELSARHTSAKNSATHRRWRIRRHWKKLSALLRRVGFQPDSADGLPGCRIKCQAGSMAAESAKMADLL